MQVTSATVYASPKFERRAARYGGGPLGALRAYQAFHPSAAIYPVEYRGRSVWMTSKQRAIWHECQKYWMRGKRDTLARIAKQCGCSRATVSRFLRRLDQWRFIDLGSVRGRNGGTWVYTRPANERPHIWTKAERYRARVMLTFRARRDRDYAKVRHLIEEYRRTHPLPSLRGFWWPDPAKTGKTGATFKSTYGARSRHA